MVSVPVNHIVQESWMWLSVELIHLFVFKLKTIILVLSTFRKKKAP